MSSEKLRHTAARWRLGYYSAAEVRGLLDRWLGDGRDGPALIRAFALTPDELRYTEAEVLPSVFAELGVTVPSVREAWRFLAAMFAQDYLEGRADASATTAAFFDLVLKLEFDDSLPASILELYFFDDHMKSVETEGHSYDGTPADEIQARIREASERVLADLAEAGVANETREA